MRAHITPSLNKLHWLPVRARLEFKTAILCYKFFHGIAPPYFSKMIANYVPSRSLRSRSQMKLTVKIPKFARIGGRAFSFYAPSLWNNLPFELKCIQTITMFKAQLKTYLFKKACNLQFFFCFFLTTVNKYYEQCLKQFMFNALCIICLNMYYCNVCIFI